MGADVNAKDDNERTPLHWAAHDNHPETAEVLLKYDADPNAKDINGHTPRRVAERKNSDETAALLREHGGRKGILWW